MLLNVKPTRMELLKLRKRIELARKGHKLLKEKRDALFSEFYKEMKFAKQLRSETESLLGTAFESLAISQARLGLLNLETFAESASMSSQAELNILEKNIMGAKVPVLRASGIKRNLLERGYSLISSNSVLDESAEKFESALEKIVSLAEKESAVARLSFEIASTKRKVNSLEKVIIPNLEMIKKYIEQRLEEREREAFYSMKKVKAKKELRQCAF
ncbi:MAG: V-type ATP synthase subunit D [Candidatus Diapherotrites archaeon]|nr:V-type ATP synthase subunit D [Candidatus Diapherotrites archaeon]